MEIRSKRDFYSLWRAGVVGNYIRTWNTLEEALASGSPTIGFREINRGGGWWELVKREDAHEVAARWQAAGKRFLMDEAVPNRFTRMQGEICRTERGLEGFLAVALTGGLPPMRQTIAAGMHRTYGYLQTKVLLERFMDPSSRDDLEALLELYPNAAIEFASFAINVGVLPHRNTIFWEVRNY